MQHSHTRLCYVISVSYALLRLLERLCKSRLRTMTMEWLCATSTKMQISFRKFQTIQTKQRLCLMMTYIKCRVVI